MIPMSSQMRLLCATQCDPCDSKCGNVDFLDLFVKRKHILRDRISTRRKRSCKKKFATYAPRKIHVDSCKIEITVIDGTRPILRMSTCVNTRERPSFNVLLRRQFTRRSSTSAADQRHLRVLPRRVYTGRRSTCNTDLWVLHVLLRRVYTTVYTSLVYRLTTESAYPRSGEHIISAFYRFNGQV